MIFLTNNEFTPLLAKIKLNTTLPSNGRVVITIASNPNEIIDRNISLNIKIFEHDKEMPILNHTITNDFSVLFTVVMDIYTSLSSMIYTGITYRPLEKVKFHGNDYFIFVRNNIDKKMYDFIAANVTDVRIKDIYEILDMNLQFFKVRSGYKAFKEFINDFFEQIIYPMQCYKYVLQRVLGGS